MIELYNADCLIKMKDIPDNSIDCIICDLPYGTINGLNIDDYKYRGEEATSWDNVLDTDLLFTEYKRLVRQSGAIILFSQEPYTSKLRTFHTYGVKFCYSMIWEKDHFANGLICKKAPVSYFEDISVFTKQYDTGMFNPIRKYFSDILSYIEQSKSDIISTIGTSADHVFRTNSAQFSLCTKETYDKLIDVYHINNYVGFMSYDKLTEINSKFAPTFTFNLPINEKYISNVLKFKKDYEGLHPTQKPIELIKYLVKIYTNEGDTVLDNCMGSGTTGVACKLLNRNFIGIEKDENYFNIAKERIENTKVKAELF